MVKDDFAKLDEHLLADKVDYVFSSTVNIILAIDTARRAVKWQDQGRYYLTLARENTPVYKKADAKSKVVGTTPPGMTRIDTDYRGLV